MEFGNRIKTLKSYSNWLARFNWKMSFHFPRVFPLISDRSVWHNGKHPLDSRIFLRTIFFSARKRAESNKTYNLMACSTSRNAGTRNTGTPEHHGTFRNTRKTRNSPQKPGTLPRKPGTPPKKTGTPPRKPGTPQKNRKSAKSKRIKSRGRETSCMHAKMKRTRSKMKIRTMNRNNLKDPRHEDFNYNTVAPPFLVSLMKQPLLGNLNIFLVQLTTSSTIERESHFKIMG